MFIYWLVLGLALVGTNRWFAHKWRYNQLVHTIAGTIVVFSTIPGMAAVIEIGGIGSEPHHITGFIYIILGPFVGLGGLVTLLLRKNKWNTSTLANIRLIHRKVGLGMVLFAPFVITFGIIHYAEIFSPGNEFYGVINLVVSLLIYCLMENKYRIS